MNYKNDYVNQDFNDSIIITLDNFKKFAPYFVLIAIIYSLLYFGTILCNLVYSEILTA